MYCPCNISKHISINIVLYYDVLYVVSIWYNMRSYNKAISTVIVIACY